MTYRRGALHQRRPTAPFDGLPREQDRGGEDGVRVVAPEAADGILEPLESNVAVVVRDAARGLAVGQPGEVSGREAEERVHDEGIRGGDSKESDETRVSSRRLGSDGQGRMTKDRWTGGYRQPTWGSCLSR